MRAVFFSRLAGFAPRPRSHQKNFLHSRQRPEEEEKTPNTPMAAPPPSPPPSQPSPAAVPLLQPTAAMPSSSSSSRKDPSRRSTSGSSAGKKGSGSASSSAASATLSSVLTEERNREGSKRNGYRRPGNYCWRPAGWSRVLRCRGPGQENGVAVVSDVRSFTSCVFLRFRGWGVACFSKQRCLCVVEGCGACGGKVSAGAAGGGVPGPARGSEAMDSKDGKRSSPTKLQPVSNGPAGMEAKPSRERVPAEVTAAEGKPVAGGGGRRPSRESTSVPPRNVIPDPRRNEKPSFTRQEPAEGGLGKPPASVSGPAPPKARNAQEYSTAGSGRGPTATSSALMLTPPGGGGKERSFVWADRYRPTTLEEFICNRAVVTELREMVDKGECDHFIFEGPPGVGKRTMVSALLREAFGPDMLETRDELKVFALRGEAVPNVQANVKTSPQHVEVNLSELRGYERHVVVALIKGSSSRSTSKNIVIECDRANRQAFVLYGADKLSTDSLHYICWLMEKYRDCFKIIFCCSDSSNLQPVKQLCKVVKLHPPSQQEVVEVLEYIAKNEGIDLPHNVAKKFADNSKQNVRQAIRSFEATWQSSYPFNEHQEILTGWEDDIANVAKNMIEEQSPRQLYYIREMLTNLKEHNVLPQFIFMTLQQELKERLDENYHKRLDDMCEEYKNGASQSLDPADQSLVLPQEDGENMGEGKESNDHMRCFMKIEEFTAEFMSFYKSNVEEKKCC